MTHSRFQPILNVVLCIVALGVAGPGSARASQAQLPPRPTPGLPPRPPVPTIPASAATAQRPEENGGHITLHIQMPGTFWTEVEWEGTPNDWHVVEGWRAHSMQGQVTWFVAAADFGKGPFRWQIYDQPGGRVLATSDRFRLPRYPSDGVSVQGF